jgi:NAD+ synthase (glutamine-hydrolysing)
MGDPTRLRLALGQINPTVGDIAANEALISDGIAQARAQGAALVAFGELAVTGYPPEDLLYLDAFLEEARAAVDRLAAQSEGIAAVVGFPHRADRLYNAAALLVDGELAGIYHKIHLPNYGVFDERRYFAAGSRPAIITIGAQRIGITICEDIWVPGYPCTDLGRAGASLIVNISASPYHAGKGLEREAMVGDRVREHGAAMAFCALVGGQDELVFDGHSFVLDHDGALVARAAQFESELLICDLELTAASAEADGADVEQVADFPAPPPAAGLMPASPAALLEPQEAEIYAALECGLRDYLRKNGFEHVVLGLSGGIDSALVATLAADALGAEHVSAVVMPSQFSTQATQADARALARRLGIELLELPIDATLASYEGLLEDAFAGRESDITEENLQARIRGNLLMALSNKFGWLVLTTGNKSEMSVGYSTLYGDSAGGFAVIKDIEKTLVYRLARWRNRDGEVISNTRSSSGHRPPSCATTSGTRTPFPHMKSSTRSCAATSSRTPDAKS